MFSLKPTLMATLLAALTLLTPTTLASPNPYYNPTNILRHNGHKRTNTTYCPAQPASASYQEELFNQYVTLLYDDKNITYSFDTYVDENLIQHNPDILSGRDNAIAELSQLFPAVTLTVLRTVFQSPLGVVHARVDIPGEEPTAIVDILRYDGTCIVEHWDVIQQLEANATNPLALF